MLVLCSNVPNVVVSCTKCLCYGLGTNHNNLSTTANTTSLGLASAAAKMV